MQVRLLRADMLKALTVPAAHKLFWQMACHSLIRTICQRDLAKYKLRCNLRQSLLIEDLITEEARLQIIVQDLT